MKDLIEVLFIVIGSFFSLTAAIGFLRFPDFFTRMHSAGKVSSFGIGFYLLALIVKYPNLDVIVKSLLCLFFIVLTTPLSAQMLMRVAYYLKAPRASLGGVDEYKRPTHPNL
jgi:multicomponent Na+:H+ antiporter subunit G